MSGLKLLVTGGLGFIGINFVLANQDDQITVVDKQTYAANDPTLLPKGTRLMRLDIRNLDDSVGTDYDWIIHFAAESHVDNSLNNPVPFWRSNIEGTYAVTEFAIKHGIKLLHISTDEVFGEWREGEPEFTEGSPYRPSNPYAISKAASDQIVRAQHRAKGLQYIITNCGNNYGRYQHPEKFLPQALAGHVSLYGDGSARRDWVHVEDHVAALKLIMQQPLNQSFVIGARDDWTIREVCDFAGATTDNLKDRPGMDCGYKINPAKLEALGWRPKHNIKEYIHETLRS